MNPMRKESSVSLAESRINLDAESDYRKIFEMEMEDDTYV